MRRDHQSNAPVRYRFSLSDIVPGVNDLDLRYLQVTKEPSGSTKVSAKLPGQTLDIRRFDTDTKAVTWMVGLLIGVLASKLSTIDDQLALLPAVEQNRPGFRPGWLARDKVRLMAEKARLRADCRFQLAKAILGLRKAGFSLPTLQRLPWDDRFTLVGDPGASCHALPGATPVGQPDLTPDWSGGPIGPVCPAGKPDRPDPKGQTSPHQAAGSA